MLGKREFGERVFPCYLRERERENEIFRERKIKIEFVLLYRSFSLETRCRVIILSWKYLRMDDRTTACSTTHGRHTRFVRILRGGTDGFHDGDITRPVGHSGCSLLARHFHTMPPAAPFPYAPRRAPGFHTRCLFFATPSPRLAAALSRRLRSGSDTTPQSFRIWILD